MALIDVQCKSCDQVSEVYRAANDWPATPPCPQCGGETQQKHFPKAVTWSVDPVIVFQAPDGSMRFPGEGSGLSAHKYERQGFRRIEIRGATEMRRFEQHMNRHEYSRAMRRVEHKQQQREQRETQSRGQLRHAMTSMSRQGRDLARSVMARNDNKPREKAQSAEFVSEVYSFSRSNREESRDSQGRRRRD